MATTNRGGNIGSKIVFDHLGIGEALNRSRYIVPVNQREYAWDEKHVKALLTDFTNAIRQGKSSYFLGTIVLTSGEGGIPEVADGQQRLATTTILLAAIRDYLYERNELDHAQSIENEFLFKFVREVKDIAPRLTLNTQDNEFFVRRILKRPDSPERDIEPTKWSHERILAASELARTHIQQTLKPLSDAHKVSHLNDWVAFIERIAQVIVLTVSDEVNAFVMFETLNDRGLRVSQADLVKNYLFAEAGDRTNEAQVKWGAMVAALETVEDEELTLDYLRHLLSSLYGLTRSSEVFEVVKAHAKGRAQSIAFLDTLAEYANDYVAILSPDSPKWTTYNVSVRHHVRTIRNLGVTQIRPLMMATSRHFAPREAEKAFRLFVSWSVRFLIAGGGRGGTLEGAYADRARDVTSGNVTTVKKLALAMSDVVPTDAEFEAAFAKASISKSHLARYFLRALELKIKGDPEPEWIPNEDAVINLEHILPVVPGKEWKEIDPELAVVYFKRLGNMVLLQASKNNLIGNKGFAEKRDVLKASPYFLTNMAGKEKAWGAREIEQRQKKLAALAVETWPLVID